MMQRICLPFQFRLMISILIQKTEIPPFQVMSDCDMIFTEIIYHTAIQFINRNQSQNLLSPMDL